jgi:tetratricopeptide (TPR) repeat protein
LAMSPLAGLPDLELLSRYDDRGRQVPADVAAISAAAATAADRLESAESVGETTAALVLLGYLGVAHRLLGETKEATRLLRCALAMARSAGNKRAEAIMLIRLGEALRYGGDLDAAEPHYREAVVIVRANLGSLAILEDFAFQHLGKCRMEQGDTVEAVSCLERALELRRAKGDPSLIASTESALSLARSAPPAARRLPGKRPERVVRDEALHG